MLNQNLINKILENKNNEVGEIHEGDVIVSWKKSYVASTYRTKDKDIQYYELTDDILFTPEVELRQKLANELNTEPHDCVSPDDFEIYYEGVVQLLINGDTYTLEYEETDGLKGAITTVVDYVENHNFEEIKSRMLKSELVISEFKDESNWRDDNKEYRDNRYVAITGVIDNEPWHFNKLFVYIANNYKDLCYKIYDRGITSKALYISKENLLKIKDSDISDDLKNDIEQCLTKSPLCQECQNVNYVHIFPYIYNNNGGCVGRLYACPICGDIYGLGIHPSDTIDLNKLNGDEKMDLVNYTYNRALELFKTK